MRLLLLLAAVCVLLTFAAYGFQGRGARGQAPAKATPPAAGTPAPTADPYANNAAPRTTQFPLAATAGKDSNALNVGPAGAVNSGPLDPATWKYGPAFNPPANSKVWNPVKLKMMQGGKVTGGTLFNTTDPAVYCAMANAGYDFIWTEMQHDARDWKLSHERGEHARLPGQFRVSVSHIPTSGKFSTLWMPAHWLSSYRPSIPLKKRSKRETGRTFRRWGDEAVVVARPSMQGCGEECRVAIEIPSTTTLFSF